MSCLSSPSTLGSPAATTTYTTAGTVYKPNSTVPLQPPTRRGRSFKWSTNSELSLLPKSVLASLPLRGAAGRAPVHQQYSPLQQNYDRAMSPGSPFVDTDHSLADMTLQGPATGRTDDSSALSSLLADSMIDSSLAQCEESETDADTEIDDGDESDDEVGMDPLQGMPFKSLQNLASYPNPMQEKARKALNVAKPILQVPSRKLTPPAYLRPVGSPPKINNQNEAQLEDTLKVPPGMSTSQRFFETKPGPTALAEGPGVPRPLTAGPPGQRQYRPATFEATWKALQAKDKQNADNESLLSESTQAYYGHSSLADQWTAYSSRYLPSPIPRLDSPAMSVNGVFDTISSAKCEWPPYKPQGFFGQDPSIFLDYSTIFGHKEIKPPQPSHFWKPGRFVPGTDRLTEEEIKAKDERNNAAWRSGSGLLSKSPTEALADARFRRFEKDHGVIGDGRPGKKTADYPHMSIEEANALPTAEHAKGLLNVTFDTLLRYRDHDFKKHQVRASAQLDVNGHKFM